MTPPAPAAARGLAAVPLDHRPDLLALAADPGLDRPAVITVRGWQLLVADPVTELHSLDELCAYATRVGWRDPVPDGPPFRGGAVGHVSDALSPQLLALSPDVRPCVAPVPAVRFGVHDWAVAVDPEGRGWLVGDGPQRAALQRWSSRRPSPGTATPPARRAVAGLGRSAHADAVGQILEWIAAGDLYQLNLTFQIAAPWNAPAHTLARALWNATPGAAHAAFLHLGDGTGIVSASPETFLRTSGDEVTTRPIKGTRARGADSRADEALAADLRSSAKDDAEHVMIVDLERNDLGRVCHPGTVRVRAYAQLERLPTLWHLTSTVRGRMRHDVGLRDLLEATFPPGSVTGTPKRMAVDRTRLVEPVNRGVYCGAVGLVGPGIVDMSVAIRTAVVADGRACYGTGGGIVADSNADAEYAEALDKAAAFLTATNSTVEAAGSG